MPLTIAELNKLKKQLPPGAMVKIAKAEGCSQAFVSMVLAKKRRSESIIRRAIAMRDKEQARHNKVLEQLRQHLNN